MRGRLPDFRCHPGVILAATLVLTLSACAPGSRETATRPEGAQYEFGGIPSLFARWLADSGGRPEIQTIADIETRAIIGASDASAKEMRLHAIQTGDGRYWYEIHRPNDDVFVQAFDGHQCWRSSKMLGVGLVSRADTDSLMLLDDLPGEMRDADASRWKQLPDLRQANGDSWHVIVSVDRFGVRRKWYFEPRTGWLAGVERLAADGQSGALLARTDFTPVIDLHIAPVPASPGQSSTVVLPMTLTLFQAGTRMVISKESVTLNTPYDDRIFACPAGLVKEVDETDRILAHYLLACGGSRALEKIKTRITKEVTDITTSGMRTETTIYQKAPNLILVVEKSPGIGVNRKGFDGHEGWAVSEIEGTRILHGSELLQLMMQADLQAALHLPGEFPLRRLLPDQVLDGHRVRVLRLATLNADAGICYFDAGSGQMVRSDSTVVVGANGTMRVVTQFLDFRTVDGVTLPFMTVETNPAVRAVTKVLSVEDNVPIADARFRMPAGG